MYCLPDMYEVQDRSLADIQYVLNPTFTRECSAGCRGMNEAPVGSMWYRMAA